MICWDEHVRECIALHFDPEWGAPYWLGVLPSLGFDPRQEIRTVADLDRFPPFPVERLATAPIQAFIPRRWHDDLSAFITSETGGATGLPKRTAYHRADFEAAFVTPFVAAAGLMGFPRKRHWLFVGPSGPHIIGKAARACAAAMGSVDPFSVDFDPRWVRKLPPGSLGRMRYLEHVLEQALRITQTQEVGVIFATPPVLEALGELMAPDARERVAGIHLGGMAASPIFWARLTADWFPNAVVLSGYGNSLAGVCPQVATAVEGVPVYVPHGKRLHVQVVPREGSARGTVRFHRLDQAAFLPCVVEGDEAECFSTASTAALEAGFHPEGLRDPGPVAIHSETREQGLY